MNRHDPDWWLSWSPVVTRIFGYMGLAFTTGVWFVTDRLSTVLLGVFGSMIAGGEGLAAVKDFRKTAARMPPAKPPEQPVQEGNSS